MGVVERGTPRGSVVAVALAVALTASVAFLLGRSSGSGEGAAGTTSTSAPAPTEPGTTGAPATTTPPPRTTTSLLADPPAGVGCSSAGGAELLGCLQAQHDELEAALVRLTAEVDEDARQLAGTLGSPGPDADETSRSHDLGRTGSAAEGFLAYRMLACAWSAEVSTRTVASLGSVEAAALACSNAVTADRVLDLERLVAGVPLSGAVGWQHPMTGGQVCDPADRIAEHDPCGDEGLRDAQERLAVVQRYLFFAGAAAPLHEATASWLRFEADDCASRLARYAGSGLVDRRACTYESFVRFLAVVDDAYLQILSMD